MSKSELNDDDYKNFFNTIIEQKSPDATPISRLVEKKEAELNRIEDNREQQLPTLPTNQKELPINSAIPLIKQRKEGIRAKELQKLLSQKVYEDVVFDTLPMSDFYFAGTRILYRDLEVKEIENYSSMDEGNLFDFKEKLQDILESATIFIHPDGTYGNFADIKDGDKPWLIYLIREKTFGKGKHSKGKLLSIEVNVGDEIYPIEITTDNIEVYRNEEVMEWYNSELACFVFNTELQEEPFYICPPTTGLKNCFDQYLKIKLRSNDNEAINKQFFRIMPFLQPHVTYMTYDELEESEKWFTSEMSADTFSFLYDLFDSHMLIGIRGLKKKVGDSTIRTDSIYPFSFKSIFVLPNAFRIFCKK